MPNSHRLSRQSGFTLIEMLTVLVIFGIMVSMAAPSLSGFVTRNKTHAALDRVAADLAFARMEAVRSGRSVSVTFAAPASYTIALVGTAEGSRTTNLATDYPGLQLVGPSMTFNSRGLLSNGTDLNDSYVTATKGTAVDKLFVYGVGRVYREY